MTLLSEASFLVTPNGYKASKLYAAIPTNGNGDMTFTRATTATRVDENDLVSSVASNVPRIDYTGGGCPSILLEPQRTNLLLRSEDFANASWLKFQVSVTANALTAPDGTLTADIVTVTSDAGNRLNQPVAVTASTTYTFSFYAKAGTLETSRYSVYDLTNSANILSPVVYSMTGEWQRITSTFTTPVGCTSVNIYTTRGQIESGTYYVWGAQLEAGAYATSYIPTTTASVTRNADVLSRDNIYTNNLIVGGGGTWFVDLINNTAFTSDANGNLFLDTASGGITNGINIRSIGTVARLYINFYTSGVSTFQYLTTADTVKLAIKWNGATADVFENGAKVVSATIFTPTAMENLGGNGSDQPKYIKQMALFAKPLTDAQCIALTTL
jgi:hypothetical protein